MSESNEVSLSAGLAADLGVAGVGPIDSRRARRERSQAAAKSLASSVAPGDDDPDDDEPNDEPAETPLQRTGIVFSDDAAAARHRRLISIAFQEQSPSMSQIFAN